MTRNSTTLADIDGTNGPAVAVLVLVDLTGAGRRTFTDQFTEPAHADPEVVARRMLAATGDDFPGYGSSVILNERARFLVWQRTMKSMGISENDGASATDYLRASDSIRAWS